MTGQDHQHRRTGGMLIGSLLLTSAFVVAEAVAGVHAHSLALLSDAGCNTPMASVALR